MNGDVALEQMEQLARSIIDDGRATRDLVMAVDQLVADRANGEPLDAAADLLRSALSEADGHRL